MKIQRIKRAFFIHSSIDVAKKLIGCLITTVIDGEKTVARIVETEAYPGADPASHLYKKEPTLRTRIQLAEGGRLYLYTIRGHILTSIVVGPKDYADVVFIRSVEPVEGLDIMKTRRGKNPKNEEDLTNGPGKLSKALGITMALQNHDVCLMDSVVNICKDSTFSGNVCNGLRINLGVHGASAKDGKASIKQPWRYYLEGSKYLS